LRSEESPHSFPAKERTKSPEVIEKSLKDTSSTEFQTVIREKYSKLLNFNKSITGFCNLPEASVPINTGNNPPVNKRQYKIDYKKREIADQQIQKWIEAGIIEPSLKFSEWNNPLLVVPKKDISGHVK
jgi:hypothetical protein